MYGGRHTYIPDIDCLAAFGSRSGVIGERVRGSRSGSRSVETSRTAAAALEATAATVTKSTAATKTAATKAAAAAAVATTHATKSATAAEAHSTASGITVFTNFKDASLPIISIELLDGIASIVGAFKNHNTRAFRSAIRPHVDISANNTASAGCKNSCEYMTHLSRR